MKISRPLRRIILLVCLFIIGTVSLVAQETREVYLVRQVNQNDVWTMNMGIQTEALRLYLPTSFERKDKDIILGNESPKLSFRSGRETIIVRAGRDILVSYDVAITGAQPLPKADRSITLRFTLAELLATMGPDTATPGTYALKKAILNGPYSKGRAWVQSIDFKDARFTVRVGLKR